MFNMKILLLTIILGVLLSAVTTAGYTTCYDKVCPESTTGCSKTRHTTDDLKYLDETVICWNKKDEVQRHSNRKPYTSNTPFADGETELAKKKEI